MPDAELVNSSDLAERIYVHAKIATYWASGPQETPKTVKLTIIGMYGVSQGL